MKCLKCKSQNKYTFYTVHYNVVMPKFTAVKYFKQLILIFLNNILQNLNIAHFNNLNKFNNLSNVIFTKYKRQVKNEMLNVNSK